MKVLLGENANQYNQALDNYSQRLKPMQAALDAYTALGYATVPTVTELAELQENPRRFLVRMITNRQPLALVGNVTVTPEKFWDLMDKPAGAEEFVATVQQLLPQQTGYGSNWVNVDDLELANGQLQVKQTVKDRIREQSRFYATTQAQVDEYTQVQAIVAALNTIRQLPRFGRDLNSTNYLSKVLLREGYAAGGNAVEVNVQAILK